MDLVEEFQTEQLSEPLEGKQTYSFRKEGKKEKLKEK